MRWINCRWVLMTVLAVAATAGRGGLASVASAQAPPAAPSARFVVVLDPAHGGDDTGGRLEGDQLEKNYTLAFSVRLRSLLAARGIQVITTREQDVAVDANHRAAIANHANAQACLVLHASESGQGVHLYVSSLAPAQPARFAAWKTAQAAWVERSVALAGVLNSALTHSEMTVLAGRIGLPGLDSMSCSAVAIEVAPQAGATDKAGGLNDADYQARVAGALAAALLEWRTEARQP
jgi:N-acetylmuramoyl-L-alanine amidase